MAYVEPKWRCPSSVDVRGTADRIVDPSTGVELWPMNYSYGMNVEGIEENNCAPGGSYPYTPAAPLVGGYDVVDCPQIFLPTTGANPGASSVHAYMRRQVRRIGLTLEARHPDLQHESVHNNAGGREWR